MRRRSTIFISLFVMFFALAAMAADEKTDDKGTGDTASDQKSDADASQGDQKGPHDQEAKSPTRGQGITNEAQKKHEAFLSRYFPLSPDQPKIFADMIYADDKSAGTALGELVGSIEVPELRKILEDKELTEGVSDDREAYKKEKDFYKRIEDAVRQEIPAKNKKGDPDKAHVDLKEGQFKTAFDLARKNKADASAAYAKAMEMMKDPNQREAAKKLLADHKFTDENHLAYANHYSKRSDDKTPTEDDSEYKTYGERYAEMGAHALDALAKKGPDGRYYANIKYSDGKEANIYLGDEADDWKTRGPVARLAARNLSTQFPDAIVNSQPTNPEYFKPTVKGDKAGTIVAFSPEDRKAETVRRLPAKTDEASADGSAKPETEVTLQLSGPITTLVTDSCVGCHTTNPKAKAKLDMDNLIKSKKATIEQLDTMRTEIDSDDMPRKPKTITEQQKSDLLAWIDEAKKAATK